MNYKKLPVAVFCKCTSCKNVTSKSFYKSMKVIINSRIPKRSKQKVSEIQRRVSKYMTENRTEQKILEFEFAHFSPEAITRKMIEVIA